MSMMWMAAGAAINVLSGISKANSQARQQEAAIRARREAAKLQYNTTQDTVNIMKGVTREQTYNAILETQRAGAENLREVDQKVKETGSKLSAKSEGVTSGRTAGRQMTSLYIQGNKALQQTQDASVSQINKLVEAQDAKTNQLNNTLFKAYQDLTATLLDEGPSINKTNDIIMGGLQGAISGSYLGRAFGGTGGTGANIRLTEGPLQQDGRL